jgi:hypothetical protein
MEADGVAYRVGPISPDMNLGGRYVAMAGDCLLGTAQSRDAAQLLCEAAAGSAQAPVRS